MLHPKIGTSYRKTAVSHYRLLEISGCLGIAHLVQYRTFHYSVEVIPISERPLQIGLCLCALSNINVVRRSKARPFGRHQISRSWIIPSFLIYP